jgi:hypothetical protein
VSRTRDLRVRNSLLYPSELRGHSYTLSRTEAISVSSLKLMPDKNEEKKRIEKYMLSAGRAAGVPIPVGEISGEQPDFTVQNDRGVLGIEVSEVLRPASSNDGIMPVEEASFQREIMAMAQRDYYKAADSKGVHVNVYFERAKGRKSNKGLMANTLTAFVNANVRHANPAVTFMQDDTPDGFDSITIIADSEPLDWWSGEAGGYKSSDIRSQLAERINSKNKLLRGYRANLPQGAQIWLLLYCGVTVARSMSIPHGIEEWKFPFEFDRVFWFTELEHQFVEIRRRESANG